MDIVKKIVEELKLKKVYVENVIELLDEGNTIPFIARYRKEKTGEMTDVMLRELSERLAYLRSLEARKEEVSRLITEQEKMTEKIQSEIDNAETLQRLEDLYRPFRPKRRTRATIAKEKGLEKLAETLLKQELDKAELHEFATAFISEEKEVGDTEAALQGAMDILAEELTDDPNYRELVYKAVLDMGIIETEAFEEDEAGVYEMYYEYKEPVKKILNHRILAINRGEKEKKLKASINVEIDPAELIKKRVLKNPKTFCSTYVEQAIEDGYKRLLFPSIERAIRSELTQRAEEEAIKVFGINLEPLLLQPPIKNISVLAIDPGFRTGCKVAVLDETGKLVENTTIYPTEPRNQINESKKILTDLINKHNVKLIAIGNGTASRETEAVVASMLTEEKLSAKYAIVNEAGASIYSASEVGVRDFPNHDVTVRGAASIGRRLQDPLAELVKIEPKHIGVGQYQHDLNQKRLDEVLLAVVEDTVNKVGVDLNTASPSLLKYVSGINEKTAFSIVAAREEKGRFKNRKELKDVKGLGAKTFKQAAGFLRIVGGDNPLDNTGVHPESYSITEKLIAKGVKGIDLDKTALELEVGVPTLKDILYELEKPGRDIRDEMPQVVLRQDILKLEDLTEGMILKGTVRNVVDFGAFVDIGVKQDGLVHISQLSDRFIKHPKDVVKVGDIVEVRIIEVDKNKNRIALSMKSL